MVILIAVCSVLLLIVNLPWAGPWMMLPVALWARPLVALAAALSRRQSRCFSCTVRSRSLQLCRRNLSKALLPRIPKWWQHVLKYSQLLSSEYWKLTGYMNNILFKINYIYQYPLFINISLPLVWCERPILISILHISFIFLESLVTKLSRRSHWWNNSPDFLKTGIRMFERRARPSW